MSIGQLINLARKEVINLVPYSSARNESNQVGIHLDANENPFDLTNGFNRYPEPQPNRLRQKLSELYGVREAQLLITRGSDEAIDLLLRVFCQAHVDGILITPPTYGMYSVSASIQGAFIESVPLLPERGFNLDVDAIIKQWRPQIKLMFLCSPNNPTGNTLDTAAILSLCEYFHDKALIVIDEAYIEFSSSQSFAGVLERFPNLIILRTISKAYGLAGARCGCVLAHPELIGLLKKVIAPYPIPTPVVLCVLDVLSDANFARTKIQIQTIRSLREQLYAFLQNHSAVKYVYPSEANFLLLAVDSPSRWMRICRERGIVIRDRSNIPGLTDCIRISIGTPEENQTLQEVLSDV